MWRRNGHTSRCCSNWMAWTPYGRLLVYSWNRVGRVNKKGAQKGITLLSGMKGLLGQRIKVTWKPNPLWSEQEKMQKTSITAKWYIMIWYDMIWYDMIWYDMIWHHTVLSQAAKISFSSHPKTSFSSQVTGQVSLPRRFCCNWNSQA